MWMTGFDAPSCSTIYLDKPMRNHTLMQTIARANRVFGEKVNGLIVDYIGVFRDLQKALAIYGSGAGGRSCCRARCLSRPKKRWLRSLREAIQTTRAFLAGHARRHRRHQSRRRALSAGRICWMMPWISWLRTMKIKRDYPAAGQPGRSAVPRHFARPGRERVRPRPENHCGDRPERSAASPSRRIFRRDGPGGRSAG